MYTWCGAQEYVVGDGSRVRFREAGALVLCNRAGALAAALARLLATRRALLAAPLYKFSFCALTNVLSAWCQYEALKYVSFPTQVPTPYPIPHTPSVTHLPHAVPRDATSVCVAILNLYFIVKTNATSFFNAIKMIFFLFSYQKIYL